MNVMDTFYDGDLKDIWDSDLDPTETLKLSNDTDLPNWFLDRDEKHSTITFNDKLISDALLSGSFPIKSEHSYSLSSDGDSLTSSPRSLPKIDDLEDECYPAISLKTATSNIRATIDPKFLTLNYPTPIVLASSTEPSLSSNKISLKTTINPAEVKLTTFNVKCIEKVQVSRTTKTSFQNCVPSNDHKKGDVFLSEIYQLTCSSPKRERSSSPDICSEIEIDESCVKDEPLSPDTSCPPSPTHKTCVSPQAFPLSVRLTNMNVHPSSDVVIENQNGGLQVGTPASNIISSQIILETGRAQLTQSLTDTVTPAAISESSFKKNTRNSVYNIPLTPPSSASSDDSQGDITPERLVSPGQSSSTFSISSSTCSNTTVFLDTTNSERNIQSASPVSPQGSNFNRNISGSCTRQPIHTPLISSQPKGSTGVLILTEEEKRTLLAEGYPIPQKLPLTKAEEKSLKKIRRKIKNKISAQESRRKKKEYMDQLERRVETLANENNNYKKRVNTLEDAYANALSQLQKLQAIVDKHNLKKT